MVLLKTNPAPGNMLDVWMEDNSKNLHQTADLLGSTSPKVLKFLKGKATPESVGIDKLVRITGIPEQAWLDAQKRYEATLRRTHSGGVSQRKAKA